MTNGVSSATVGSAFANNLGKSVSAKDTQKGDGAKTQTKVDELTKQVQSGEYKIDINTLAEKMAEELSS